MSRRPADFDMLARLTALEVRVQVLEQQLHARTRPPCDRDAAVIRALAAAVPALPFTFTSREVLAHARIVPPLRRALRSARATNPRKLGKLLERLDPRKRGTVERLRHRSAHETTIGIAGFALTRITEERAGVVWQLAEVTSATSDNPLPPALTRGAE